MLQSVFNAFKIPDLRRKIIFTLLMLIVFRIVAHIPVPGVDLVRLEQLLQENQLLGMLNLFCGSALRNFSIAAMGVYPYITATIIFQLLIPIVPRLKELSSEGESGRAVINRLGLRRFRGHPDTGDDDSRKGDHHGKDTSALPARVPDGGGRTRPDERQGPPATRP